MEQQNNDQISPKNADEIEKNETSIQPRASKFTIGLPAAIITAAVIIGIAIIVKFPGGIDAKTATQKAPDQIISVDTNIATVRATDHVYNNPNTASVIIYEYSDSDCPYCQQFHATMKQVLSTYGTKIAWVYRFFPLSIHPDSYNEALALQCAADLGGNDAFFKYLDSAFSVTVDPTQSASILTSFAKAQDLDENLFKTCIAASSTKARVDSDDAEAQSIGAQGTPFTIIVNKDGKQAVIPGAYPFDKMKEIIDGLLK